MQLDNYISLVITINFLRKLKIDSNNVKTKKIKEK